MTSSFIGGKSPEVLGSQVEIHVNSVMLEGNLSLPKNSRSIVLFAHGSGSSRFSPRNSYVAQVLQESGFGTLLFDLLTEKEDVIYENRFDIELLTHRLVETTHWIMNRSDTAQMKIGYFGASTGAAAALEAAAKLPNDVRAVVSRGGRPDLAISSLSKVRAPTLLIVGERDEDVLDLNRQALKEIIVQKELVIVPTATHLFEEPGTLEKVAQLATRWFTKYL